MQTGFERQAAVIGEGSSPLLSAKLEIYTLFSEHAKRGAEKRYVEYIEKWKQNLVDGMRGKTAISAHIRRYLFQKYDNKCARCNWSIVHPITGNVPLEVEHLDGDHTNNIESNLELICPNCHSLTSTYRALNMGNGRPRK